MRYFKTETVESSTHGLWKGGKYKQNGYTLIKVKEHPKQTKRGYVAEHTLVMENNLNRYLNKDETVHHINRNRNDNRIENLELKYSHSEHLKENHIRKRNKKGQLVASSPIFQEIKFRLYNKDRGDTKIYTLSQLIGTTFRRGCFEFRGRYTGIKDKNGKEIYRGDVLRLYIPANDEIAEVEVFWDELQLRWATRYVKSPAIIDGNKSYTLPLCAFIHKKAEIIGNVYENKELIKETK